MATDAQLTQWAGASLPVAPDQLQEWSVMVNAEEIPLATDQEAEVRGLLEDLGATNIEVVDFRPTRINLPNTRARRETIEDLDFVPTLAGTPVWWRVRFAWRSTATSIPWPAFEVSGIDEVDPTDADILVDSVGGKLEPAPAPEPGFFDSIGGALGEVSDTARETAEGIQRSSQMAVIGLTAVGALYFFIKLNEKRR